MHGEVDASAYRRALLYLVTAYGEMSRVRLQKLMYLIDLEHHLRHGRTLTGAPWERNKYGPMSKAYLPSLAVMNGFELLEREVPTRRGRLLKLLGRGPKPRFIATFEDYEVEIIDFVLTATRLLDDDAVKTLAYTTTPMLVILEQERMAQRALIGMPISFDAVPPTQTAGPLAQTDPVGYAEFKRQEAERWRPIRDRSLSRLSIDAIDSAGGV